MEHSQKHRQRPAIGTTTGAKLEVRVGHRGTIGCPLCPITIGFCSQGAFLVSLGIDNEIKRLASTSDNYLFELAKIKKLIMPQGMGESYKVMVQYKGDNTPKLKGFSIRNQIKSLS